MQVRQWHGRSLFSVPMRATSVRFRSQWWRWRKCRESTGASQSCWQRGVGAAHDLPSRRWRGCGCLGRTKKGQDVGSAGWCCPTRTSGRRPRRWPQRPCNQLRAAAVLRRRSAPPIGQRRRGPLSGGPPRPQTLQDGQRRSRFCHRRRARLTTAPDAGIGQAPRRGRHNHGPPRPADGAGQTLADDARHRCAPTNSHGPPTQIRRGTAAVVVAAAHGCPRGHGRRRPQ